MTLPLQEHRSRKAPVFLYKAMVNHAKPMVLYICDGTKCTNCNTECHHTADRAYARDTDHEFVQIGDNLWEKPKPWDDWKL